MASLARLPIIVWSASSSATQIESTIHLVDASPASKPVLVLGDEPYRSDSNSVK